MLLSHPPPTPISMKVKEREKSPRKKTDLLPAELNNRESGKLLQSNTPLTKIICIL